MCVKCLAEAFPDRERTVLESGHYLLNFVGCAKCSERTERLGVASRKHEEEEGDEAGDFEETIEFDHACSKCGHVIASHYYCFRVRAEAGQQEYSMSCALCGKGEDVQRIIPTGGVGGADEEERDEERKATKPISAKDEESVTAPFASLMAGLNLSGAAQSQAKENDDAEWD